MAHNTTMFSRKDGFAFGISGLLIVSGYLCMVVDPTDNGFGFLTLWVAPPLLLTGFLMPVLGILGIESRHAYSRRTCRSMKHWLGLLVFVAALAVYMITLEPTASLWDCSEFIACAYKLQVPHTPGNPLALLFGRSFSMLSFGNVELVAWWVNLMSGVFSAMAVSVVYYIIDDLGTTMWPNEGVSRKTATIIGSCGGSLCLAFSDSFWFSAAEAETYGAASFFLVLLVWLILKGKDAGEPLRSRMLILISYLSGLAYCIHPMCLLALTILPFTWCKARNKTRLTAAVAGGLVLVFLINRLIAVGVVELAFSFDRFFVNQIHLPFYSGALILFLLVLFFLARIIRRYDNLALYAWVIVFLLAGFTPYLMLFIRSNHNPPIDEANPENLPMIKAYMNRESYPSSPLLFGPYFDAEVADIKIKKQVYFKGTTKYEKAGTLPAYEYNSRQTVLPRLYSKDPNHIAAYRAWLGLAPAEQPTFADNLRFLFTYQLNHMYLRYLMWNFAGRESDKQNSGWLKPWERVNRYRFERARNQYWMIPLLIGIAGALVQMRKDPRGFVTTSIFFMVTGMVLALYLNSPPVEPRERDYIYVGSYIAFSIWIGLGMLVIQNFARRFAFGSIAASCIVIGIPLWMLYQNYDDHNRAGRTFQVDNARNVLRSCAPRSILFTGGDNDTFPLWYLQEVEGFRTDVRVMVLSYLNTDWYISQLRKSYYDSDAFKLTLNKSDYRQYGPNDVLYVQETVKQEIDLTQYLRLLKEEHPALRGFDRNGELYHILPGRKLGVEVKNNSNLVADSTHTSPARDESKMTINISANHIEKNVLAILDLVASNGWERPVHFNFTSVNTLGIDLTPYLRLEGQVYRLVPEKHKGENIAVNTDLSYKYLVEDADYSNLQDPDIHLSYEDHHSRMIVPVRQSFNVLAVAFLAEGRPEMAWQVLAEALNNLYPRHLRPSYTNLQAAQLLIALNKNDYAYSLSVAAFEYYFRQVKADLEQDRKPDDLDRYLLRQSAELLGRSGERKYLNEIEGM